MGRVEYYGRASAILSLVPMGDALDSWSEERGHKSVEANQELLDMLSATLSLYEREGYDAEITKRQIAILKRIIETQVLSSGTEL